MSTRAPASLPAVREGAHPRFHLGDGPRGRIGCLILHGFMASPSEVWWLGDHLIEAGYSVSIPRLPGHGVDPRLMARMRWLDWYLHARDAYDILAGEVEQVAVIGHSMGGLLAAQVCSAVHPAALVLAAVPHAVPSRAMPYARWLSLVYRYSTHETAPAFQAEIRAEQARRGQPQTGRVHYSQWSNRAVYELYRLILRLPPALASIQAPTLVLNARHDDTVTLDDQARVVRDLRSRAVETRIIEAGGHLLFLDAGHQEAAVVVGDFLARHIG
jgi:carboxylesterase